MPDGSGVPAAFALRSIDRRDFLKGVAALGVTAALAGCGVSTGDSKTKTKGPFAVEIPDSGAKLPSGETTIRFLNGGPGPKSFFFSQFLDAYRKKHPNITVQYDELPNKKIGEVLPLQLRSGNVADLIFIPGPLGPFAGDGQLAPVNDLIPDYDNWQKAYPFGIIAPGVEEFNGKTYAAVPGSNKKSTLLLYNSKYMDAAGYDPGDKPLTWDELRAAAKKITKAGAGQYYGLMLPGVFKGVFLNLTELEGFHQSDGLDWKTGEYNYNVPEVKNVIEALKAIKSDGSFFPGWAAQKDGESRARTAEGHGGMTFSGPWNFPVWKAQNPDFKYGVSRLPASSDSGDFAISYEVGGSNTFCVYANAKDDQKAIAGDILHFLATDEGQRAWAVLTGSADPPWSGEALQGAIDDGYIDAPNQKALDIFDKTLHLAPSPLISNPENDKVKLALKPVKPHIGQVVQGILTGELTDVDKALTELSDKSNKALDDAITKAKKQGAKVSRDDWAFPNWDATKDYGKKSYQ